MTFLKQLKFICKLEMQRCVICAFFRLNFVIIRLCWVHCSRERYWRNRAQDKHDIYEKKIYVPYHILSRI